MTEDPDRLARENDYLKRRNAQLQAEVSDLTAEVVRLQQRLGAFAIRVATAPNPLSGGQ
ncbi:hypothetical protein [Caulobacter hibisci]|uniref:Transposase n=1 Tax=Caulobacter hibisci TaxID=2035993 RepID=A0ABS0T231_9CAUL|nr:hypothetical protein [Caulobacter hibisci]MBI1685939.1 hypothetical protein [Caulobacter hibisci]